jgi:hypothetical protein
MIGMCVKNLRVSAAAIAKTYKTPLIASIGLLIVGVLLLNNYHYIIQPLFRITAFLTASILLYCASVFLIDRPIVAYLKNIFMLRKSG